MAIDDAERFPPEPTITGAHSLVRNGLMQTDMDAQGYRILNLDTSNLVIPGIPSQGPVAHKWFHSYDSGSKTFGVTQPLFSDISGNLSTTQQRAITHLGTISEGIWSGTVLLPAKVPSLSFILPPTAPVNLNHKNIRNLADPVTDEDGVNLRTLVARALGPPNPKAAVMAATTASIGLVGLQVIDGYQTVQGDRILVKDQPTVPNHAFLNGIYNASAGTWTRTEDADTGTEMNAATVFVLDGDTQIGTTWLQTTILTNPISSQQIIWVLLSTTLALDAGPGLDISGNTIFAVGTANRIVINAGNGAGGIDIASSYAGQASIDTVGTIDTGTWEADIVAGEFGGTGVANTNKHITLAGDFTTSLAFAAPVGSFLTFALAGSTALSLPVVGTVATTGGNETFTNKHISADQIDSGLLPVSRAGTGGASPKAAMANLLPSQVGHNDESLHTDGAGNLYWA